VVANYALPQDVLDMARDVMRHRLGPVVRGSIGQRDRRRRADGDPQEDSGAGGAVAGSVPTSAPAPEGIVWTASPPEADEPHEVDESRPERSGAAAERILQRLDWQVIRRLDGVLQGDYRSLLPRQRNRSGGPARIPARRTMSGPSTGT